MKTMHHLAVALAAILAATAAADSAAQTAVPAAASAPPPVSVTAPPPFSQRFNTLANGIEARQLSFASANPASYEDIIARKPLPPVMLEAKLYVPKSASGKVPAVIITPGSGGVNAAMLEHARALTDAGIAVMLVDPFGGRGVRDTIAAQNQFPFAASTYDVFAAMLALAREPNVDTARLGAMGYSRGGLSVLQAAITPLAQAALGGAKPLRAVLAGWPWCGYQFADAQTVPTAVRYVSGDADDYVSTPQCQGYAGAMKPRNPDVSFRLFRDARHGFGYGTPIAERPQAIKALLAPVVYFDAQGVLLDPYNQQAMPGANDAAIEKMLMPFITRGVTTGSKDGQMNEFIADLVAFFTARLR